MSRTDKSSEPAPDAGRRPTASTAVTMEVFVEPFREAEPGPHVTAAVDALTAAGLSVDMGPFATGARGDLDQVVDALPGLVSNAMASGATQITLRIGDEDRRPGGENLHDALDRMVAAIESDFGATLPDLSRGDKQAAVRLLHAQGAFLLRHAVEDVAALMSVSRITIYNYINAIEPG